MHGRGSVKRGFSVQKGGALKRKSQSDPAGDAFGYVESVINECARALPMVEAGDYAGALANLGHASTFLQKGSEILKHIGEVPLCF